MTTVLLDADGQHVTLTSTGVAGDNLPPDDVSNYPAFLSEYRRYAAALKPLLGRRPPRLKDMDFTDMKSLAKLGLNLRFGLGRDSMYEFLRVAAINIYDVLNEAFEDERLKGGIAADAVLGNAMGPRTPGTVLTWLQRLHGSLNGGLAAQTGSLVTALVRAAENHGVEIRCDSPVTRILVENGRAFGVELASGELLKAKCIVSNADPRTTLLNLVGAPALDAMFANRVSQIRGSGVVGKLNLALSGRPQFENVADDSLGARLIVAPSLRYVERAFNHSKYDECSTEPVLEILVPSAHDDSIAPDGHHVMTVNVAFVPYSVDGGWQDQKSTYAYKLISMLGQYCPDLKSLVVDHEFLTPVDIEAEYGAIGGHWHHGELSIHQSFMMRPVHGAAQYDTPVDGLFLCSAGCHPGGGLTGLPGRNAAERVLETGGGA